MSSSKIWRKWKCDLLKILIRLLKKNNLNDFFERYQKTDSLKIFRKLCIDESHSKCYVGPEFMWRSKRRSPKFRYHISWKRQIQLFLSFDRQRHNNPLWNPPKCSGFDPKFGFFLKLNRRRRCWVLGSVDQSNKQHRKFKFKRKLDRNPRWMCAFWCFERKYFSLIPQFGRKQNKNRRRYEHNRDLVFE